MTTPGVSRWIRGYDKVSGRMLVEYRLPVFWSLERLQHLFGMPEDNPMFDCFPVHDSIARLIESDLGINLLLDDREFFLEADAE